LDIIDINPGVCLWSSKVHLALKPRDHVLVESDRHAYRAYIDPLLKQKGSRYSHVPFLSDLFAGRGAECLPHQTPVTPKTISRGCVNDTLLILANLSGLRTNQPKFAGSASVRNIHYYINGMMSQEHSLHHYGLVRMLAWIPDHEKGTFLPRTITDRKKFSVRLDLVAEVSEVAGGPLRDLPPNQARRQHELTLQSEQLAAQRAKDLGIWDPQHRRSPPSTPPWYEIDLAPDALDQLRSLPQKLPWQNEMLDLEDVWSNVQQKAGKNSSESRKVSGNQPSEEPESLRLLRAKYLTVRKARLVARDWANRQNELDRAQVDLFVEDPHSSTLVPTREDIQRKTATLHAEMAKGRNDVALLARKYIDDRRGFEQQNPLLQWDRRLAEPLAVQEGEFFPARKMALLDLKPVPDAIDKLSDFDKRTFFAYVCSMLFRCPSQGVKNGLTTVVQGGLDDFIKRVPDLSNPLKGGNLSLDDLRVRTLSVDLLVQLALALETWPFRLQTHEMIINTGKKKASPVLEEDG
jgi:mitochondrial transcription factor 1